MLHPIHWFEDTVLNIILTKFQRVTFNCDAFIVSIVLGFLLSRRKLKSPECSFPLSWVLENLKVHPLVSYSMWKMNTVPFLSLDQQYLDPYFKIFRRLFFLWLFFCETRLFPPTLPQDCVPINQIKRTCIHLSYYRIVPMSVSREAKQSTEITLCPIRARGPEMRTENTLWFSKRCVINIHASTNVTH